MGARSVGVCAADGVLRVNGDRVTFAGVNRHETCPVLGGPCVSLEATERDVELLKQGHFNAVRTAHYPHAPALYAGPAAPPDTTRFRI